MEYQAVMINGKQRQAVVIRGQEYVREGYDVPVSIAEAFERKCDLLGECKSKIVEKLVIAFTECNGWGQEVKQPPVFERRSGYHVKDALFKTLRGLFPWRISEN